MKEDDISLDSFYLGRILVLQKKKGYRFSLNAPLLADFIKTRKNDNLLELGAGNGIVSLLLSIKPFKHITAVEIQESLAKLAEKNIQLNHLQGKIEMVQQDLRDFHPKQRFDVVFSNPPYIKKQDGRLNMSLEKAIARHELKCDIFDIIQKIIEVLKNKGRAYLIYPERRRREFMKAIERYRLKLRTFRSVLPHQTSNPKLFLVECSLYSKRVNMLPPMVLYDEKGRYTTEAKKIFSGRIHDTNV